MGVGGLLLVGLLLVGFAAATGWMGPVAPPPVPQPVVVEDPLPPELRSARDLPDVDDRKVRRTVREARSIIGQRCGTFDTITAVVLVEPAGRIALVHFDKGSSFGKAKPACVREQLVGLKVPGGVPYKGKTRVDFTLK